MKNLTSQQTQISNELYYSRVQCESAVGDYIDGCQAIQERIDAGVEYLQEYLDKSYYESKQSRVDQVKNLDLRQLVRDVFVGTAFCQVPVLFTSISAQMAGRLGFNEKAEGIQTSAEIIAVLCLTDAYDIIKTDRSASLMLQSNIELPKEIQQQIDQSEYLPPMVCKPLKLEHNHQSAYLTHNDCLILGKGNSHTGNICLDVLNKANSVPLKLDTDFLNQVPEEPTFDLDTLEKTTQWSQFKSQSQRFYDLMIEQGNYFYLTHKVDKRGRIYAQGYHITTQGTSYKKAMLELADEETVDGVPN